MRKGTTDAGRLRWGTARAAFLARLEELRPLVLGGHSLRAIYDEHCKAIGGLSYSGFTRLVRKHIRNEQVPGEKTPVRAPSDSIVAAPAPAGQRPPGEGAASVRTANDLGALSRPPSPTGGVVAKGVGIPRVTHNPNASSREDLV